MARIDNLDNFLTDIATAIRTKTEKNEQIPAEQFDQEILSIEGGIDTSDATATADDIISPKTAYVKDGKVTGTILTTGAYLGDAEYVSNNAKTGQTNKKQTTRVLPDGNRLCINGGNVVIYDKDMNVLNTYLLSSFGISTSSTHNSIAVSPYYDETNSLLVALTYSTTSRSGTATISIMYYNNGELGVINHSGQTEAYKTFTVSSGYGFFAVAGYHTRRSIAVASRDYGTYRYDIKDDLSYTAASITSGANLTRVFTAEITEDDGWLALNHDVSWDGSRNSLVCLTNGSTIRNDSIYCDIIFVGYTHVIIQDNYYKLNPISGSIALVKNSFTGMLNSSSGQNADMTYGYYKGQYNKNLLVITSDNSNATIFAITDLEKGTILKLNTVSTSSGKAERAYKTLDGVGLQTASDLGQDYTVVLGIETCMTAVIHGANLYNTYDATITPDDVLSGKTAYCKEGKIEGTMPDFDGTSLGLRPGTTDVADFNDGLLYFSGKFQNTGRVVMDSTEIGAAVANSKVAEAIGLTANKLVKGSTVLGIEGTAEGGTAGDVPVKLFETKEQMQNDTNAKEGDLAVVYREDVSNWDGASAIASLTFPKTVVLPNTMTGSCYGYSMGNVYMDIDGSVSASSASFRIYGDSMYEIVYTSTDGLTYTRTDAYNETLILADEPTEVRMYEFSEVCGYFMKVGGMHFDGLYEYKQKGQYGVPYNFRVDNNELLYDVIPLDIPSFAKSIGVDTKSGTLIIMKRDENGDFIGYYSSNSSGQSIVKYNGKLYYTNSYGASCYYTDLSTGEQTTLTNGEQVTVGSLTTYIMLDTEMEDNDKLVYFIPSGNWEYNVYVETYTLLQPSGGFRYPSYYFADTQLNLTDSSQLLPGKIGYGKNGVIEGNNTIYDNLSSEEMFIKTLGLPKQLDDSRYRVYDTAIKPSAIGDYAPYTATYVKETLDKANAKYKIGIVDKYYTLRDITYITGEFYSNGHISRMTKTGKFGAVVKTITNEYKLLVINADFTEVEKVINVTATNINVSSTNRAMMLTITESDTVYKYAIFNVNLGTLVTYTTHTSNVYYTTKLMEDYAVCTVNKETFIIDLNTDSVTKVGSMEYNWMTTRVFEFDDFFYVVVLMNDGTITEKLYRYNKTNSTLSLQASYTGGPFSSNTTGVEILGKTCVESTNYILDYATGLLFRKENTSSKNTLFFCKRRITDGTILTGTSKWCGNNIINQGLKVYKLSDNQNITFDDLSAGTPIYNLAVDTIVKTMNNIMGITVSYDSEIGDYRNTEYSFNYTNVFKLDTVDEFECCDFSVYSKFKIKYFNDDLTDADYMLIRTSFVEPNYGFGSYIKLLLLNADTILHEEYDVAVNTTEQILNEEV